LAPPARVGRLDRLFAPIEGVSDHATAAAFPFNGDVRLGTIADLYGIDVPRAERELTIADLFADRFDDEPREGSSLALAPATLIATAVEQDRVMLASLEFEAAENEPSFALPDGWLRRVLQRLRLH
jgi:cell volume regulation protein A